MLLLQLDPKKLIQYSYQMVLTGIGINNTQYTSLNSGPGTEWNSVVANASKPSHGIVLIINVCLNY